MKLQIAHQIPLLGHPTATAQAVDSTIADATTLAITLPGIEIEIVEGDYSDDSELVVRLRGNGKLVIVPSSANSIRIRRTRY